MVLEDREEVQVETVEEFGRARTQRGAVVVATPGKNREGNDRRITMIQRCLTQREYGR